MKISSNKKLYPHEWLVIFLLLSSIGAVLIVGGIKRKIVKNQTILLKQKDFIVEKSSLLVFFPPMNRFTAHRK